MIFFLSIIDFYSKQRNKLLALLKVHTESVDLYNSIINILKDACSSYCDSMQINTKFNIPKEFFCRMYASIVMTSIQWFVENNEDYTPQDFTELFSTLKILSSELL